MRKTNTKRTKKTYGNRTIDILVAVAHVAIVAVFAIGTGAL